MNGIQKPYVYFGDAITLKQTLCLDKKTKGFKRGPIPMDRKVECKELKAKYDKYLKDSKKATADSKVKKVVAPKVKKVVAPKVKKVVAPKKCAAILSSKFKTEDKFKVACKSTIQNKQPCRNYRNPSDKKMYCYSKSNKSKISKNDYKSMNAI